MSNRGATFVQRALLSFSRKRNCKPNLGPLRYHVVGPVTCRLRTKAKQFGNVVPQLCIRKRKTSERRVFLKAVGYVYWETCDVSEYFVWTIDRWSLRHLRLATTHLRMGSVGNITERSVKLYRVGQEKVARVRSIAQIQKLMQSPNAERLWRGGGEMVTARLLTDCSNALRNIYTNARENITRTREKWKAGYFFLAHSV